METITVTTITSSARPIIRRAVDVEKITHIRTFKEHFGVSPWVTCCVWNRLVLHGCVPSKAYPIHLLWTLLFLKVYNTERVLASSCQCDPETYRNWVKAMLEKGLVQLEYSVIRWEYRFRGDKGCMCKSSVDCTDCPTLEPQPFDPANFSYKENGPGVRYEIGLCIQTGDIVWVNGPFRPGEGNDDTVAKTKGLWDAMGETEYFLADSIYSGWRAITPNGRNNPDQYMKSVARSRHENVNSRFKRFAALKTAFRHGNDRHGSVFHAVNAVCQVEIEVESPLARVDYDDLRYSPYD